MAMGGTSATRSQAFSQAPRRRRDDAVAGASHQRRGRAREQMQLDTQQAEKLLHRFRLNPASKL